MWCSAVRCSVVWCCAVVWCDGMYVINNECNLPVSVTCCSSSVTITMRPLGICFNSLYILDKSKKNTIKIFNKVLTTQIIEEKGFTVKYHNWNYNSLCMYQWLPCQGVDPRADQGDCKTAATILIISPRGRAMVPFKVLWFRSSKAYNSLSSEQIPQPNFSTDKTRFSIFLTPVPMITANLPVFPHISLWLAQGSPPWGSRW